jgi:hypothetical protein
MKDTVKVIMSLKELLDKVVAHVSTIEEHNAKLCEALQSLLNEDDIKELPAYELLKMTYSPYLTYATAPSVKLATSGTTETLYDPLHAPPSARYGSGKKTVAINTKRPIVATPSASEVTHYSNDMPDMDSCLLGGPGLSNKSKPKPTPIVSEPVKPKPTVIASEPVKTKIKIQAKADESVYRVEIQGKNYLRYNEYLYDENNKRAGSVSDFKLGMTTEQVELEPIPDCPDYYMCDTTVYILVNNEIAQAVGTYENDEIALWS